MYCIILTFYAFDCKIAPYANQTFLKISKALQINVILKVFAIDMP